MNKEELKKQWEELLYNAGEYEMTKPSGKKFQISISKKAWYVLEDDRKAFNCGTYAELCNTIIENYWDNCKVNPLSYYAGKRSLYKKVLKSEVMNKEVVERVVNELIENDILEFRKRAEIKDKKEGRKIYVNKENHKKLVYADDELKYTYIKPSKYISAIIEEYATLPYADRVVIIKRSMLERIREAIQDKKYAIIKNRIGMFLCKPWGLMEEHSKLYLVNVNVPLGREECEEFTVRSNQIARIDEFIVRDNSYVLTKQEEQKIITAIEEKGITYLGNELGDYRVSFTEEGLKQFMSDVYRKPEVVHYDGDCYEFHCTDFQAENYFWKYGKDAVIVNDELHEKMKKRYQEAYQAYDFRLGNCN